MLTNTLRLLFALAFAAVLSLVGLTRPRVADAQASTFNEIIPFDLTVFNPCAEGGVGEFVHLTGSLHVVSHGAGNDNHLTIRERTQAQGLSGVGLTTGDLYHESGMTQITATFQLDGEGEQSTLINRIRLVGQGPGNNFTFQEHGHATFNGNGELTVNHYVTSIECQ